MGRGLLLVAALLAAPACWAQSPLFVVRRGWHIDVGFAAADLDPPLRFVATALPSSRYIFFGFGDMRYLLSHSHGASTLAAALWPGRGIMLVTGLQGTPQQGFGAEHVVELTVNAAQLRALQNFVVGSFVATGGTAHLYEPGPYEGSDYFLAVPHYSALHTCNTWVAEALHAASFHVHHVGVLFAGQVWGQVNRLKRSQDVAAARQPGSD